jgi:hypothetical protein
VVKFVLQQISKVLPNDPAGRHDFVTSGGLGACQALDAGSGTALKVGRCRLKPAETRVESELVS